MLKNVAILNRIHGVTWQQKATFILAPRVSQIFLRISYITDKGKRTNVRYKDMDERKKRKREVRKEDGEENLGNRSFQNVGIYQRMYRCHILHSSQHSNPRKRHQLHGSEFFLSTLYFLSQSRNIPHFMEPDRHYHVQNSSPFPSIPNHIYPVHAHQVYSFRVHFNIILQSTPKSSN